MAECAFHPGVETEVRCGECERPICPKDMVPTPVGYKCPICAKPAKGQITFVKPRQFWMGMLAGAVTGVLGGVLVSFIGFGWLGGILWGMLVAESVRRAAGGHRGGTVGAIAGGWIAAGGVIGFFTLGLWFITPIIAIVTALVQLAVIGQR